MVIPRSGHFSENLPNSVGIPSLSLFSPFSLDKSKFSLFCIVLLLQYHVRYWIKIKPITITILHLLLRFRYLFFSQSIIIVKRMKIQDSNLYDLKNLKDLGFQLFRLVSSLFIFVWRRVTVFFFFLSLFFFLMVLLLT